MITHLLFKNVSLSSLLDTLVVNKTNCPACLECDKINVPSLTENKERETVEKK
jgi:hypothetical protein